VLSSFHHAFEPIKNEVFIDHNDYVTKIKDCAKSEFDLDIELQECETSKKLGEVYYAECYDSLTGEPVALQYQLFLETNKPMSLRPDICSWKTYARNDEFLKDKIFGTADIPHESKEKLKEISSDDV